ncbi:hypothetical protein GUITHDRAFT_114727, partial [Guillardia theta CCMP2712]
MSQGDRAHRKGVSTSLASSNAHLRALHVDLQRSVGSADSKYSLRDNSMISEDDGERRGDDLPSVMYGGRKFATLDGTYYMSERTSTNEDCQTQALRLPKGWAIAPDDWRSREVISQYTWGTDYMLVESGSYYRTTCWYCSNGGSSLRSSDGLYWPASCNMRILIVYVGCPQGQTPDFCSTRYRDSATADPAPAHFQGPPNATILNTSYLKSDLAVGRNWSYILSPSSVDDGSWRVPDLGFPFCVGGNNVQSSVYISSNSYLTFGQAWSTYTSLSASNPYVPTLFVGAGDTSAQLIVGTPTREGDMRGYVVRFEGTSSTSGLPGHPNLIFEVTFFANNTLRVAIGMQNTYFSTMYMMSDGRGSTLTSFSMPDREARLLVSGVPSPYVMLDLPCVLCNNSIPPNAIYSSDFSTASQSCNWICQPGFYLKGESCAECEGKPSNASYSDELCGWTCDVGFYKSGSVCMPCTKRPANAVFVSAGRGEGSDSCAWQEVVEEEGYVFSTLGGYGPTSQYSMWGCVSEWQEYLPLPAGWSIAPDNEISINVTAKYDWGALRLVLDSSSSYFTNSVMSGDNWYYWYWYYWQYPGSYYSSGYLSTYDRVYYRSSDCEARVLLLAPVCASGYMAVAPAASASGSTNASRCVPCSNTIPSGAQYVLSPYPQEASSCGWSCQVGFYPSGSTCSKCAGKPSAAVYVGAGLMGKADSCAWSCLPGYREVDGWRCEACASSLPPNAHWEGSGCSWACDFGYRQSGSSSCDDITVGYNGQRYASLGGRAPYDSSTCSWEGARALPEGWVIAPNTGDSISVVSQYPWGASNVVLEDGTAWNTGYGGMCCTSRLYNYDGMFTSRDSCGTVLVVAEDCLAGYYRDPSNMTRCIPCSSYKPDHATYNSSGSPANKNNCDWQCDAGYYRDAYGSSCVACSVAPPNAVYTTSEPGESCSWTCHAGYYLQDGACKACETSLPEFAYFTAGEVSGRQCEWSCRFGYVRSNGRCVGTKYAGRYYTTLSGRAPNDPYTCRDDPYLPVPAGWELAPNDQDSQYVTWYFTWGSNYLVFSDGSLWYTARSTSSTSPQQCCWGYLSSYNGMYKANGCDKGVLLRSTECAPGYLKSGSSCVPCSNALPANSSYGSLIAADNQLISTCAYVCNAGYKQQADHCVACDRATLPAHAEYVQLTMRHEIEYECQWRCSAGYLLKDGQCVACEDRKPRAAHWLREGSSGTACGWACDFGYFASADGDCLPLRSYGNRYYAALDGSSPYDPNNCNGGLRAIPAGWAIAANTGDSRMTAWMYTWGPCRLMMSDGSSWYSSWCTSSSSPQSECCYSLVSYDGMYRSTDSCGSILLVSQYCAAGYYLRNDSSCGNCSNPIPPHALYVAQQDPSRYADSVCPWACEPGYTRRGEACQACETAPEHAEYVAYGPGGVNGSWTECGWRCSAGYLLKDGQCVACEDRKPRAAHWLREGSNGTACGWACDFGYFASADGDCLPLRSYGNRYYAALDGSSLWRGDNSYNYYWYYYNVNVGLKAIPAGWAIAANTGDSRMTAWMYTWGPCRLMMSDGSNWYTSGCSSSSWSSPQSECCYSLVSYDGMYRSTDRYGSILLVSQYCAAGYYLRNDSSCGNCSNPIPPHALYVAQQDPSRYADSVCPWACEPGYTRRGEACQACETAPEHAEYVAYGPGGVNGSWTECGWRCSAGYLLKDGQCVACEDRKPRAAHWLREGSNGTACGWACDFGYFASADGDCVLLRSHGNRYYAALDGSSPYGPYYGCNYARLKAIPAGWAIAANTGDSRMTAWMYTWGPCRLMMSDGSNWYTSGCSSSSWSSPQSECCYSLVSYDGMYRSTDSCGSILLVSQYCAAGYYLRNDSSCGNCSNPIPPHALYVAQQDPSRYADSVCPWAASPGYTRRGEACQACETAPEHAEYVAYGPGGVNGSWTECGWRCSAGYLLKDSQCVACEDRKPRAAHWLREGSNGTACGWACDFGHYRSQGGGSNVNASKCEMFQYGNRFYTTLQGHRPDDPYQCNTPLTFSSIPAGWAIAANTGDSQMAIATQRWGVCYLQLSDSSIWYTSSCQCCNYPYRWGSNSLIGYDGMYRSWNTCSDILLMSLFCAPGFYLSGSYCYPCSNPIPANASYALPSSPSQYADSKCPWECNAGFYRSSEWMVLTHVVRYLGKVYAAFDDVAPTSLNLSCQHDGSRYQQPPAGWTLAPWSEEAVRVVGSYPWGARAIVLANGVAYQTAQPYQDYMSYQTPGTRIFSNMLYSSGNSYALSSCDNGYYALRMLLVRLECDDGYVGRGDQDCTPCSGSLPANAVASSGPGGCGWTCRAGYYKAYEGCASCDPRYPKPSNALYVEADGSSGQVCQWRCGTGHYRSQGACVPCMNAPNFAYFLDAADEECAWRCQPGYFQSGTRCLACKPPPSPESDVVVRPASMRCNITRSCRQDYPDAMLYQCGWIFAVTSRSGDEYAVLMDNMTEPWDPLQGPLSSSNQRLQCGMVQLPAGWQVAPNDTDTVEVIARYPWGLQQLVVSDGTVYATSNYNYVTAGRVMALNGLTKSIRADAELYALSSGQYCQNTRILIKKIRCAPGQYVSGSSCRACSTPVCNSGEHALACQELQDSICSSALKPCTGKCRCQLFDEARGSMSDGSALSSLYEDGSNCRWIIQPPGASSISLNFTSFALEPGYDFLTINECIGLLGASLECYGRTEVAKLTGLHKAMLPLGG